MSEIKYVKDTFEEYLNKKDHFSASDLKMFLKSPRSFFYYKNNTEEREEQRHFAVGSALHMKVMEEHLFNQYYIVAPKFDRRTKQGKEDHASFVLKAQGKTIIYDEEMQMIENMAINVRLNKTFMELMEGSHCEVSCYTTDEASGLKVRLRPDIMPTSKSTLVDIKSCNDSSPKKFKSDVYNYGYALSGAFYMDFLKRENYVFASIEKNAPYQASLYVLSDDMIDQGRFNYRMALDLLKWSIENEFWCDYVEFEILKDCYLLGNLDNAIETIEKSELINILH
jgi:hypothetical protein